jgi:putative RNA 2'-phosphotransferase
MNSKPIKRSHERRTEPAICATSKFLSFVLRHEPEAIGLSLDHASWADVDALIACSANNGRRIDRALIAEVVSNNDKQRFELSADHHRIRARQGHSIPVDLGLEPVEPPELLYHGTATRFVAAILAEGLEPQSRQHVHLSRDLETALRVGRRHGKPVVFTVAAGELFRSGHPFYLATNGVWLTTSVPAAALALTRSA